MTNSTNLSVRVSKKKTEAQSIVSFELVPEQGSSLPAFSAGSHIDVLLRDGLVRQYSLCNASEECGHYLIAVLKDPQSRGGSIAMHDSVREGDVIQISSPKNHFLLLPNEDESLLLAGGIGVTPILCMAEHLARVGSNFEMHYCTRSPTNTAFVERIRNSLFADVAHFHFDDGPEEQKFDLNGILVKTDPSAHLYVCGPSGFMDSVLSTARRLGWADDRLHYEFFGIHIDKDNASAPFDIVVASSGKIVRVSAEETAVQALAAAGIDIPTSCEQGVCGTCLTGVLKGVPDHKDMYLTASEQARNDQFLPCCSRAMTSCLELDL